MDQCQQNNPLPLQQPPSIKGHAYSAQPGQQAENEMELSANDSSLLAQVTPAQREPQDNIEKMEHSSSENIDDESGFTLVSRKRPRQRKTSGDSQDEQQQQLPTNKTGLTVIFILADPNINITRLNSTKLTKALEEKCEDCIVLIRPNTRLNLIAVDTRNIEAMRSLLAVTSLCKLQVRAYEPGPRSAAVGVIRGVDQDITDTQLKTELRAYPAAILHARRLGSSGVVKIQFASTTLPEYALISCVRYQVFQFEERPLQCSNCGRYGHKTVACFKEAMCSRCGGEHDRSNCDAEEPNCVNCGRHHDALALTCPKRVEHKQLADARKQSIILASTRTDGAVRYEISNNYQLIQEDQPADVPMTITDSPAEVNQSAPCGKRINVPKRTYSNTLKMSNLRPTHDTPNDKLTSHSQSTSKETQQKKPRNEFTSTKRTAEQKTTTIEGKGQDESFLNFTLTRIIKMLRRFLSTQDSEWAKLLEKGLDFITPFLSTWIR
ncbi:unnamed protein product [Ixodes hexagonus]